MRQGKWKCLDRVVSRWHRLGSTKVMGRGERAFTQYQLGKSFFLFCFASHTMAHTRYWGRRFNESTVGLWSWSWKEETIIYVGSVRKKQAWLFLLALAVLIPHFSTFFINTATHPGPSLWHANRVLWALAEQLASSWPLLSAGHQHCWLKDRAERSSRCQQEGNSCLLLSKFSLNVSKHRQVHGSD